MSVESTLFTRLSTFAGLTSLVSTRIYPLQCPQGVIYPALVYQRISTPERDHAMGRDVPIARPRFQFTVWAETMAIAIPIIEQVRLALQRWSSDSGGVFDCFLKGGPYDLEDLEALKKGRGIDFEVIHSEVTS